MMNMAMQMMEMHSKEMHSKEMPTSGMDMAMMQECIEACTASEQACTMCAGSMMGDNMARVTGMCLNTADMCSTMTRTMMRPNGMHAESMMAMMRATMMMCTATADECMMHADASEDFRMCAEACRQSAMACQKMTDSMTRTISRG